MKKWIGVWVVALAACQCGPADECRVDDDCGFERVCEQRGEALVCLGGDVDECRVDEDCGFERRCVERESLLVCVGGEDDCRADADCAEGERCLLSDGRLSCVPIDHAFVLNGRDYVGASDLNHVHAPGNLTVEFTGTNCSVTRSSVGAAVTNSPQTVDDVVDDETFTLSCDEGTTVVTIDLLEHVTFVTPESAVIGFGETDVDITATWTLTATAPCRIQVFDPGEAVPGGNSVNSGETTDTSDTVTLSLPSSGTDGYSLSLSCADDAVPVRANRLDPPNVVHVAKVNTEPAPVKVDLEVADPDLDVHFGESFDFAWDIEGVTACSISDGADTVEVVGDGAQAGSLAFNEAQFNDNGTGVVSVTCVNGGGSYVFSPAFDFDVTVRVDVRSFAVRFSSEPLFSWAAEGADNCILSSTNGDNIPAATTQTDQIVLPGIVGRHDYTLTCTGASYENGAGVFTLFGGNITGGNPTDLDDVHGVTGSVVFSVAGDQVVDLNQPLLRFVGVDLNVSAQDIGAMQSVVLGDLSSIGGTFTVSDNDNLTTLDLPKLVSVGGNFGVVNNLVLTALDVFPSDDPACGDLGLGNKPCADVLGNFRINDNNDGSNLGLCESIATDVQTRVTVQGGTNDIGGNKTGC